MKLAAGDQLRMVVSTGGRRGGYIWGQSFLSDANLELWTRAQDQFIIYRRGDAATARQVFTSLLGILRVYYRLRLGVAQDAEDLSQITLLKIHLARDRYDPERSFKAWVYTVASRCLIDHWRGAKGRGALGQTDDAADAAGQLPDQHLSFDLRLEYSQNLEAALSTLKPIDRAIVYLTAVEGLSMAEVAELHGLTPAAAKVRAHRGYLKLRELLT